jgi:CTP synthase (UTP-ammonia lyase)
MKQKIAAFCNVEERAVIGATTVPSIYEVPLGFAEEGVDALILKYLHKDAPGGRPGEVEGPGGPLLPPQGRMSHRHRGQVCGV